ncbi:plasmid stabilization protein [Veronia nyctiphanis]|uniref:Plasmid stabilization protein n=1 Tax=Veronia nyctiphanis TaxID=1278244 RepID=A0A4Q0YMM3_9GAMM|nr:type II toxin-antitoxin system RelE/ParE family toxin [Veronia nyctiphanis]RXJ71224.1 plasmid stabilization protein [Veronia nyctiphanis]
MPTVIEYTQTFEQTTALAIEHYAEYSSENHAIEKIEAILDTFEEKVSSDPFLYARSQSLLELGITEIREANIADMRLLYEVSVDGNTTTITALVLLSQKQSVEGQLVNFCLICK